MHSFKRILKKACMLSITLSMAAGYLPQPVLAAEDEVMTESTGAEDETPEYYKVVFDASTADAGSMEDFEFDSYTQSLTLPKNTMTREGYTFTGWSTTIDGKDMLDADDTVLEPAFFIPDLAEIKVKDFTFEYDSDHDGQIDAEKETYSLKDAVKDNTLRLYPQWKMAQNRESGTSQTEKKTPEKSGDKSDGEDDSDADPDSGSDKKADAKKDPAKDSKDDSEKKEDGKADSEKEDFDEPMDTTDEMVAAAELSEEEFKELTASASQSSGSSKMRRAPARAAASAGYGTTIDSVNVSWITEGHDGQSVSGSTLTVKPSDDLSFSVQMRVDVALSGENAYPKGSINIRIPNKLIKDRNNKYTGRWGQFSVPAYPDASGLLAYYEDTENNCFVLTNTREIEPAKNFYFEVSIENLVPHELKDKVKGYISDNFSATCSILLDKFNGNTLSRSSGTINVNFDTSEKVLSAEKRCNATFLHWSDTIPEELEPSDSGNYFYIDWYTVATIQGNQPATMKLTDNISASGINGAKILGYSYQDKVTKTNATTFTLATDDYVPAGEAYYVHVYAAYPRSAFTAGVTKTVPNSITYTMTSSDDNQTTTASAQSSVGILSEDFPEPTGHFNIFKHGLGGDATEQFESIGRASSEGKYGSALNKLMNGKPVDLNYQVESVGFGMPWTLNPKWTDKYPNVSTIKADANGFYHYRTNLSTLKVEGTGLPKENLEYVSSMKYDDGSKVLTTSKYEKTSDPIKPNTTFTEFYIEDNVAFGDVGFDANGNYSSTAANSWEFHIFHRNRDITSYFKASHRDGFTYFKCTNIAEITKATSAGETCKMVYEEPVSSRWTTLTYSVPEGANPTDIGFSSGKYTNPGNAWSFRVIAKDSAHPNGVNLSSFVTLSSVGGKYEWTMKNPVSVLKASGFDTSSSHLGSIQIGQSYTIPSDANVKMAGFSVYYPGLFPGGSTVSYSDIGFNSSGNFVNANNPWQFSIKAYGPGNSAGTDITSAFSVKLSNMSDSTKTKFMLTSGNIQSLLKSRGFTCDYINDIRKIYFVTTWKKPGTSRMAAPSVAEALGTEAITTGVTSVQSDETDTEEIIEESLVSAMRSAKAKASDPFAGTGVNTDKDGDVWYTPTQEDFGYEPYRMEGLDNALFWNEIHNGIETKNSALTASEYQFKSVSLSQLLVFDYVQYQETGVGYYEQEESDGRTYIGQRNVEAGRWAYKVKPNTPLAISIYYGTNGNAPDTLLGTLNRESDSLSFPPNTTSWSYAVETKEDGVWFFINPVITIKPSARIKEQSASLVADSNRPIVKIKNTAELRVWGNEEDESTGKYQRQLLISPDIPHKPTESFNDDGYLRRKTANDELQAAVWGVQSAKTLVSQDNDVRTKNVKLTYNISVTEATNLSSQAGYDEAVEDGLIKPQTKGTFYDLLPLGVKMSNADLRSVKGRRNDQVTSAKIVKNWKNSNRDLLVVEMNLIPRLTLTTTENAFAGLDSRLADCPKITFQASYSWESMKDYTKTLDNAAAFVSKDGELGSIPGYQGENVNNPGAHRNRQTAQALQGIENLMTGLPGVTGTNNTVYCRDKTTLTVNTAAEAGLTKAVTVDGGERYGQGRENDDPFNVFAGDIYTYRLRYEPTGNGTSAKNIRFFDELEQFVPGVSTGDQAGKDDQGDTRWNGQLVSIDVSSLTARGVAPKIYYTTEKKTLTSDSNMSANNLSNSFWKEYSDSLPAATKAQIKGIAVDASRMKNGSEFSLPAGQSVSVFINMKAPENLPDTYMDTELKDGQKEGDGGGLTGGAHAYNNVAVISKVVTSSGVVNQDRLIRMDYTKVGIIPFEFRIMKEWDDDDDRDGIRPASIQATVYADGVSTGKTVELNDGNEWTATIKGISPIRADGTAKEFTVVEKDNKGNVYSTGKLVNGYTLTIRLENTEDGVTALLTNQHTPEPVKLGDGVKRWDDSNNDKGKRPASVKIGLYQNGKLYKTTIADASTNWTYSFGEVPKYYDHGKLCVYTIGEPEYYDGYNMRVDGMNLTNPYTGIGDLTIYKDILQATSVSAQTEFKFRVKLTDENGKAIAGSFEFTRSDGTKGKFTNGTVLTLKGSQSLTIHDIPSESNYEVTEDDAPGWQNYEVTGNKGTIKARQDMFATVRFKNLYEASGNVVLRAKKELSPASKKLISNLFTVEVKDESGKVIMSGSNDANGDVTLGGIRYYLKDVGKTFHYTITEKNEGRPGYTYDTHSYGVDVKVEDNGDGTLKCTPTYQGGSVPVFRNPYHATGEISLKVWKKMIGQPLSDDDFTFTLTGTTKSGGNITKTAKVKADSMAVFPAIQFNEEDIYGQESFASGSDPEFRYLFRIKEEKSTVNQDINYDPTIHNYRVIIQDNGDGKLICNSEYLGTGTDKTVNSPAVSDSMPVFENPLKDGTLRINKRITSASGEVTEAMRNQVFQYRITLKDPQGNPISGAFDKATQADATNGWLVKTVDGDGNAVAGATVKVYWRSGATGDFTLKATGTTNSSGVLSDPLIYDMNGGQWRAEVTVAPEGYKLPETTAINLTVSDGMYQGTFTLIKNEVLHAYLNNLGTLTFKKGATDGYTSGKVWLADEWIEKSGADAHPWNSGTYANQVKKIVFETEVAPKYTEAWFANLPNLTEVENPENFTLSNSTDHSCKKMFSGDSKLKNAPAINTVGATTMEYMFENCIELGKTENYSQRPIIKYNASACINMKGMFYNCTGIRYMDADMDTSNVKDMSFMFYNCSNLPVGWIPMSVGTKYALRLNFDVRNVTTMESMFENSHVKMNDEDWGTSNTTGAMWLGLYTFCPINCTNFKNMFKNCPVRYLSPSYFNHDTWVRQIKSGNSEGMFKNTGMDAYRLNAYLSSERSTYGDWSGGDAMGHYPDSIENKYENDFLQKTIYSQSDFDTFLNDTQVLFNNRSNIDFDKNQQLRDHLKFSVFFMHSVDRTLELSNNFYNVDLMRLGTPVHSVSPSTRSSLRSLASMLMNVFDGSSEETTETEETASPAKSEDSAKLQTEEKAETAEAKTETTENEQAETGAITPAAQPSVNSDADIAAAQANAQSAGRTATISGSLQNVRANGPARAPATQITFDANGQAIVNVKASETLTISNLPGGAVWTVEEINLPAGWHEKSVSGTTGKYAGHVDPTKATNWSVVPGYGRTGYIAPLQTVDSKWVNEYNPDKTSVTLTAQKYVKSGTKNVLPGSKHFRFELLNATTGAKIGEAWNNDGGLVIFDAIEYTTEGTYYYKIREAADQGDWLNQWKPAGKSEYPVTVKVQRTNGVLTPTVMKGEGEPVFVNDPTTPPSSNYGTLKIRKECDNAASSQNFQIQVTYTDGNLSTVNRTLSMRAGQEIEIDQIALPASYQVSEVNLPSGYKLEGITNASGTLTAGNSTSAATVVVKNHREIQTYASIEAEKEFDGGTLEAGQFSFQLYQADSSWNKGTLLETKTNTAPLAEAGTGKKIGQVLFSSIKYDKAGTYYYVIKEVKGSLSGVEYDTSEKRVTVQVTENNNALSAKVTYGNGKRFVNRKAPGNLQISKQVTSGTEAANNKSFLFKLTLKDKNGNDLSGEYWCNYFTFVSNDMTSGVRKSVRSGDTIPVLAGTTTTIHDLPDGTRYELSELDADGFVLDVSHSSGLSGTISSNVTSKAIATNVYDAHGSYAPKAKKTMNGATLQSGQFRFVLKDSDGYIVDEAVNDRDGNVNFSPIEYDLADAGKTFTYTIVEVSRTDYHTLYDGHELKLTVKVTDNGTGVLKTEGSYTGDLNFTNYRVMDMPQTGRSGIWIGTGIGLALAAYGAYDILKKRKKK